MIKHALNYLKFLTLIGLTLLLPKAFYKRLDSNWCTDHTLSLIARLEGFYPKTYKCQAGCLTIGFGHIVEKGENFSKKKLTKEQAFKILESDLITSNDIFPHLENPEMLEPHQIDALISFTYNLGAPEASRSWLIKAINEGNIKQAYDFFAPWSNVNDKKSPGIAKRRLVETMVFANRPFDPNSPLLPSQQWGIPMAHTDEIWKLLKKIDSVAGERFIAEAVNIFYEYTTRRLQNLSRGVKICDSH
jgi:lysozyme